MKVFEVITEHPHNKTKEIIRTVLYATADTNDILTVATHYSDHCFQYEKNLISVREVLTITEQVKAKEDYYDDEKPE